MEAERVSEVNMASLYTAVLFFGTRFPCRAVLNSDFSNFRLEDMRADGATAVPFLLTEGWKEPLVLVNLQDHASANKDPMCGVPLLAQMVPVVSKAKGRKACVGNIQLPDSHDLGRSHAL